MIRQATRSDAEEIAHVFRAAVRTCLPYLTELHTPAEELTFFRDVVMQHRQVWIGGLPGTQGFCAFGEGWVDHLYIRPTHHGRGIGSELLNQAKSIGPSLQLWVFQRNTSAIRFYQHHGFRIVEASDGSRNEEQEPDFRMLWNAPAASSRMAEAAHRGATAC
jgi:GNAT superfamily N-acetyltransferase